MQKLKYLTENIFTQKPKSIISVLEIFMMKYEMNHNCNSKKTHSKKSSLQNSTEESSRMKSPISRCIKFVKSGGSEIIHE